MYNFSHRIVIEKFQNERNKGGVDSNEQVDTDKHDVGRTRLLEEKRCWVHERGDGPP